MNYTRWYDKDVNIKLIVETMEKLDEEKQVSIAMDIIQMITEIHPQTDTLIEDLNSQYIPSRRRWYDKYETLHTAIELLKILEDKNKDELLKEIFYSIIYETHEPQEGYK